MGVASADYDNDGKPSDLFGTGPVGGQPRPCKTHGLGTASFEDVTEKAGRSAASGFMTRCGLLGRTTTAYWGLRSDLLTSLATVY